MISDSFGERGIDRSVLRLAISSDVPLKNPKIIDTFNSENADFDLLTDHIEAFNRFNYIEFDSNIYAAIYGGSAHAVTSSIKHNEDLVLGALLPRTGLGYRLNERHGKNVANAGRSSTIKVIDRIGRIWHRRHLAGIAPYVDHPHFIVVDMSPPGWGIVTTDLNEPAYLSPREGNVFNIQYFRDDGSDDPFDFVLSNNGNNVLDNSTVETDGFNAEATLELIKLLIDSPEVKVIRIDPAAKNKISALADSDSILDRKIAGKLGSNL